MARLNDPIIQHPEAGSFKPLEHMVAQAGESDEMDLEFDVKPTYRDTTKKWKWRLETMFTRGLD